MLDPTTSSDITSAIAGFAKLPAVRALLGRTSNKVARGLEKGANSISDALLLSLRSGLGTFLDVSFERCRCFKSLLAPEASLDLEYNYLHVTLSCGDEKVSDTDLANAVDSRKRLVITGTAGSGKSMFMKFLTLNRFKYADSIPLFVDLRRINAMTHKNLLSFIRYYCADSTSQVDEAYFKKALRSGYFTLVLDGFDEVNYEFRDELQKQILELTKDFSSTAVVVSSRPDDRFGGWIAFDVFKVDPLSETQCINLIEGLPYDSGVKKRFLDKVRMSLFASHSTFLKSPLLTTIMLLTFEQYADIPDKMHSFYGLAFDTLFWKHDAQKEQFERRFYTGLTREEFRSCFAVFCGSSYLEEKFEFTEEELQKTANRALIYAKQNNRDMKDVTAQDFIEDLRGCVCMIHADGLLYTFTHRSFQEYFAARFVLEAHGERGRRLLDKYSSRPGDNVIPMALDIDREGVEQKWVLPTISRLESAIFWPIECQAKGLAEKYKSTGIKGVRLVIHSSSRFFGFQFDSVLMSTVGSIELLKRVYRAEFGDCDYPTLHHVTIERLRKIFKSNPTLRGTNARIIDAALDGRASKRTTPGLIKTKGLRATDVLNFDEDDDWWLAECGIERMLEQMQQAFQAIRDGITRREQTKSNLLQEFFSVDEE